MQFKNVHTMKLSIGRFTIPVGGEIALDTLNAKEQQALEVFKNRGFLEAVGAPAAAPKKEVVKEVAKEVAKEEPTAEAVVEPEVVAEEATTEADEPAEEASDRPKRRRK